MGFKDHDRRALDLNGYKRGTHGHTVRVDPYASNLPAALPQLRASQTE